MGNEAVRDSLINASGRSLQKIPEHLRQNSVPYFYRRLSGLDCRYHNDNRDARQRFINRTNKFPHTVCPGDENCPEHTKILNMMYLGWPQMKTDIKIARLATKSINIGKPLRKDVVAR